jgi:hypothetical protein
VAEEWALSSLSSASAAMAGALRASDSFGAVFNSSTCDRIFDPQNHRERES